MKLRAFFVVISVTLLYFRVGMATTTHPSTISTMTLSQVNRILWNSNLKVCLRNRKILDTVCFKPTFLRLKWIQMWQTYCHG